jgi:macrolide transport system ATP-binding/permease protein
VGTHYETTMMQRIHDSYTTWLHRSAAWLVGGFAALALLLSVIGLYGVIAYSVSQRTREIGVRMALGADRFAILRAFLARGLAVASVGVVLGLAASWMVRPVVSHLLIDSGVDVISSAANSAASIVMNGTEAIALAAAAILIASLAASWLPARRASSIEPMQALRTE